MSDVLDKTLGRRSFLKATGYAGLAVGLVPILEACGAGTQSAVPSASGPAATGAAASTEASRKLRFLAWSWQPDVIKGNVDAWSSKSGVPVDVEIISNAGYIPAVTTRFQGGDVPDVYYSFTASTQKFLDAGWAQNLADLPGVNDALGEMYPNSRKRHVTLDGRVISMPYFSAVHQIHYNPTHLSKAGIGAPPTSRQEIYDQCKALKNAGVSEAPYLGFWGKQYIEEYLLAYLLADGVTPFDDSGKPVFADDPRSVDVLEWWQSMYQDGMAPQSTLTDLPDKQSLQMANGDATFYYLHHYFLKVIRDINGPESDKIISSPTIPGTSGVTLQVGETVQMGSSAQGRARDDAWSLLKYYTWKDDAGKFGVFQTWSSAGALGAPYPGFWADPEIRGGFPEYYDLDSVEKLHSTSDVVAARTLPWYADFQNTCGDKLQAMLLGQATPSETIKTLADAALRGGGI